MTTLVPKYDQGATGAVNRPFNEKLQEFVSAEDFDGADIGAKINQAVASGARRIRVNTTGAISTSPNLPMGSVIDFAPGVYTISTTWSMSHHSVIYNFNGAVFRSSVTGPVFDIAKLATITPGTVNTSGTAVTWVSGPLFSDFDIGDMIIINNNEYNIDAINSDTSITLTGVGAPVLSGVAYSAIMNPQNPVNNSANNTGVIINNVNVSHAANTGVGIRASFAFNLILENVNTNLYYDVGIQIRGCIGAQLNVSSQACPITINSFTAAGFSTGSNYSEITASIQGIISGDRAILIGNSGVVLVKGLRIEGNGSQYGLELLNAGRVTLLNIYAEGNGNATNTAADIALISSTQIDIIGGQITTVGASYNAGGSAIYVDALSQVSLRNLYLAGNNNSYNYGVRLLSGATASLDCCTIVGMITDTVSGDIADTYIKNTQADIKTRSLLLPAQELIYNGNFSQGATAWTLGAGWSIGGGVATATSVSGNIALQQNITNNAVIGCVYKITFTISNYTSGTLIAYINGSLVNYTYTSNGTKTIIYTKDALDNSFSILGSGGLSCDVDNISMTPIPITSEELGYFEKSIRIVPRGPYANNAAAVAAGLVVGELYYVNAATDPQPVYIVH